MQRGTALFVFLVLALAGTFLAIGVGRAVWPSGEREVSQPQVRRTYDRAPLLARGTEYLALFDWMDAEHTRTLAVVPVSALTGENMDGLLDALRRRLPVGPQFYPEDQVTDLQVRFIVAELIREKALMYLQQEVPHSLAVVVDEFKERSEEMTYISAVLYVERTSQKGIVLGKNGAMIKKIGQAARPEIEALVGTQVYLELWVKVWEKWRTRENMLRRLGYATQ